MRGNGDWQSHLELTHRLAYVAHSTKRAKGRFDPHTFSNFRRLRGWGWPSFSKLNLWRQVKGQKACTASFVNAVRQGSPAPIPLDEVLEVSRVSIKVADGLRRSCNG